MHNLRLFMTCLILLNFGTTQAQSERVILMIAELDGETQLYTVNPDKAEPELFMDLTAYGRLKLAKLSPDGAKLAFVTFDEETWFNTLVILDIQSGEITHLRTEITDVAELNWSSDGIRLIYLANGINGDFGDIYSYDTVTHVEQELEWYPVLYQAVSFDIIRSMEQSPDGLKFLFSVLTLMPEANLFFIIINADGTDAQQLPLTRDSHSPFAWNQQADTIYFVCDSISDHEAREICRMDLSTLQTQTAISHEQIPEMTEYGIKEISVDKNRLAVDFLIRSAIYIVDLQTGVVTKLLTDSDYDTEIIGWIDVTPKQVSNTD